MNRKVRQAEEFFHGKHNEFSTYDSLENLILDGEEYLGKSTYKGLMHHMTAIRAELVKVLWQAEVYIGVSIIDELVFQSAKKVPIKVCQDVLSYLTRRHAGKAGFVLYPLHGFGIEQPPLFGSDPTLKPFLHFQKMGVCFAPQSNSFDVAYKRVLQMASSLGVVGKIDPSDLHHYQSPGAMDWFTRNPLMMVKIASHTGAYYENQFVYTLKIRIAASLAAMLYAIGADRGHEVNKFASTASLNNWETLDIRHYLIGEAGDIRSTPIDLRRVPMNLAALDLARLSDLTITLSSRTLGLSFLKLAKQRLITSLKVVEAGFLAHVNIGGNDKVRRRVFARVVTALDWYRQSFGARVTDDEAIVALAVAFETLLTDAYMPGVMARVVRRLCICLKGRHGIVKYVDSVVSVMKARGAIVHNGSTLNTADLIKAQAAFALCFEAVVSLLPNLGSNLDQPVGRILCDV